MPRKAAVPMYDVEPDDQYDDSEDTVFLNSPLVNFEVRNTPDKPPEPILNTGDDAADMRALIDRYQEELKRHARYAR